MEELVRRLFHETCEKTRTKDKPPEAFRRYFGPEYDVEPPLRERHGYRPIEFDAPGDMIHLDIKKLGVALPWDPTVWRRKVRAITYCTFPILRGAKKPFSWIREIGDSKSSISWEHGGG